MTPIDLPRLTSLPEFDDDYRERMLWGTYRCGQYLGAHCYSTPTLDEHQYLTQLDEHVLRRTKGWLSKLQTGTRHICTHSSLNAVGLRMRRPTSLLAGLMWFDPDRPDALDRIRHNAQERDGAHLPLQLPRSLSMPD